MVQHDTSAAKLFYSYSSVDESARGEFERHLAVLRHAGVVQTWSFRQIEAGDDWRRSIDSALNDADIIVLLVSASFLSSEYCWAVEMKRALERQERGEAVVIPIILRDCDWKSAPFAALQALPKDGKPISRWRLRDTAWTDVVGAVRQRLQDATEQVKDHVTLVVPSPDGFYVPNSVVGRRHVRDRVNEPWRLALLDEGAPTLFAFKASNWFDGICEVERHNLADGRTLFVIADIDDNPGQSTTNSIEYIAHQLAHRFDIAIGDAVFVEHFVLARATVEWNLVEFQPLPGSDSAGTPRWRPMTAADWDEFGVRPRRRRAHRKESQSLLVRSKKRVAG